MPAPEPPIAHATAPEGAPHDGRAADAVEAAGHALGDAVEAAGHVVGGVADEAGHAVGDAVDEATDAVSAVVDHATAAPPPEWSRSLSARVEAFDDAVDALIDRHLRGRPAVDRLMYSVTELADFSLLWHLLGAARGLTSDRAAAEAVRLSAVLGVESTVVNGGLKSLFRRERPVPEFERPHHLRMPLTTSFPSGHASAAFCAATLLGEGRSRPVRAGWFALAGVVATSRAHVRIHHASDVVGGAVVGLVVGRVARRVWPRPR